MDSTEIILIACIAEVFNCLVLYFIILSATNTSRRSKYNLVQIELLAKIARAHGVQEDEIRAVLSNVPEISNIK